MPYPRVLEISRTIAVMDEEDNQLVKLQRLIETFSARNRQFLIESGERQAEQTRKKLAKKIKEAQLRKAAAKLESVKRKEQRRKSKIEKKFVPLPLSRSTIDGMTSRPLPLSRSTTEFMTYSTPGTSATYKRSLSHSVGDTHKIEEKFASVPALQEMTTPLVSNKQAIRDDLIGNQLALLNLDKSDKVESSSFSSSSSSSSASSSSSLLSSSSNSSESDKGRSNNESKKGATSERERSDFDEDFIWGLFLNKTMLDLTWMTLMNLPRVLRLLRGN